MIHQHKGNRRSWRVESDPSGHFDEVVVRGSDKPEGLVLHAEAMSKRHYFITVAGLCLWVHVGKDGVARITGQEDRRV